MPLVPTYERDLQAFAGVMDASSTLALTSTAAQVTFDANFGPTALNCTIASDKDDITVNVEGIYEYCFQSDVSIPTTAGTVTVSVRDDGTNITGALATVGWITADLATKRQMCVHGLATIAAGSVLDVAALTDQNQTATFTNSRFWVRRVAPSA